MSKADQALQAALSNPKLALLELDALDCKDSLIEFTKRAWHALEPGTKFVTGWAVEAMAAHLEAVSRGEVKRLLINVPPGFTKSMLTNVMWPAWEWGPLGKPHHRFISTSYDKKLAVRDLVRCRDLLRSEWFRERWRIDFKEDEDGKEHYSNKTTGWRVARSVGSGLTGWRGDRIIIDDPHSTKMADSEVERQTALLWFTETIPTRLNNLSESAIVVIMQRLHQRDISGHILAQYEDYTKLILPMEHETNRCCRTSVHFMGVPFADPRTREGELLWPERFPESAVETLKKDLSSMGGSYAVSGQLQQRPVPRGGGMFRRSDFLFVDSPGKNGKVVRAWDLAATKDGGAFTVGLKLRMEKKRLIIEDVVRFQGSAGEVEDRIRGTAEADGKLIPISLPQDPGQSGKAQKVALAQLLHGYDVHFSPETGSKEDRAKPVAAQAEAGNLSLVRAPWNDLFLGEAEVFPNSHHKDQIDALSRAYSYLLSGGDEGISLSPGRVFG